MSRKKKGPVCVDNVLVLTSAQTTRAHMPKLTAYQGGYGAHGPSKYDRRSVERAFLRDLREFR